mgnify:CR=1 FL=1
MKATGIVRRIDDLGRVVIPKELRRALEIAEGDPLEIFTTTEKQVILQKYHENEPEKNGLPVNTELEKGNKITVTYDEEKHYLTLSDSALAFFNWLADHDFLRDYFDWEDGHHFETESFLE